MRIELTWPRADGADRTLTVPMPEISAELLRTAHRASTAAVVRRAISCVQPIAGSAAGAAGAGVLVQLALPYVLRVVQQALDDESVHGTARSPIAARASRP